MRESLVSTDCYVIITSNPKMLAVHNKPLHIMITGWFGVDSTQHLYSGMQAKEVTPAWNTWIRRHRGPVVGHLDRLEVSLGTSYFISLAKANHLGKGWLCLMPCIERKKERKKVKLLSWVRLFASPWTVAYQASPSMGFSRQEYWSGFPSPSPGDLPDPGTEPSSPAL